jgi:hypothetical protein
MTDTAHTTHAPGPRVDGETGVSSLQIVCAWCRQPLAWHWVQTPVPFPISYSICGRCYAAVAREFAPLPMGTVEPGRHDRALMSGR